LAESSQAADLTGAALLGDSELVALARQGDRRAFGTLYLRHHDAAWRVACTAAGSSADAEDAVAEGFAKVFAALPRMVDRDLAFRPYLLACVRNAAVDRHRRERKVDLRDDLPEGPVAASEPDEIVLEDLERNLVGEALRSLPERWRTVLWLTEVEGMTPAEVSAVIGIKPNAVAALSYRAREGLREAYLQAHVKAEAKAECRYTVDRLGPYVRGELAERERVRVQAHLDRCAACRQRRDELADVNASLLGALVPVPLLLGSRTQQEWISKAHLGKGTRRARTPAKAAKAAKLGTSAALQATVASVVALVMLVSGAVALERFGDPSRPGKGFDPLAVPKTPAAQPVTEAPVELAGPAVPAPEAAAPSPRRVPIPAASPTPAGDVTEVAAPFLPPSETAPAPAPPPETPAPTPPAPAPPVPPAPERPPALAAAASIGEGANGAVVGFSVPDRVSPGDPQPDVDLTVGTTPVLGDASPSKGTSVDLEGSLLPDFVSQPTVDPVRAPPGVSGTTGPPGTSDGLPAGLA
jgi:RNA polymerase sigma factor (sigma-70 family)